MMAGQKKAGAVMGVGVTSLLTIMAVLLLTSFAVMSLLSANSDLDLSRKASQAVTDYYAADGQAEEWWMDLNEALEGRQGGAAEKLRAAGFDVDDSGDSLIVRRKFPMGGKKNLEVQVSVSESGDASIECWQSVPVYTPRA
jgi:hypothetical protein